MRNFKLFLAFFFFGNLLITTSHAAEVDTVDTYSEAMKKNIKAVIITPADYKASTAAYPVVYLLHGYGGRYSSFVNAIPAIKNYSDVFKVILVCPDSNIGSWYFDSPTDNAWKYETYTAKELVSWVDGRYRTIKDRKGRGVTGFSMGGHGAMYLSFKHQDVYGVAGSMSGGVDFRPFPKNWEIAKRLGSYSDVPQSWDRNTVINMIDLLRPGSLDLIIDCGTEDFFFEVNNNFHQKLLEKKIPHDYIVRPGGHNWPYWDNAILYQLLFMSRYFSKFK
ncbi:alpha/beta hydrolase [Desertivirga arenae]|uniref:alpha/beta hydrolase n=1 Tax=Desertivirga arenae TaxID=2810309 RepID=UPI001A9570FB|nr:alpha/beta hydrolase family protein [Pedobacter sp. SYSU D00823]